MNYFYPSIKTETRSLNLEEKLEEKLSVKENNWKMCRERDFKALSPKWGVFIKLPLRTHESMRKRRRKDCSEPETVDNSKDMVSSGHNRTGTQMNPQ